ncbi:MAG: dihydrolipoyl dehydrogenase [Desulfotignum sp.]|nr:dihydrolipoyl dehydrogenase [Desulfotignum sp.]
MVVGEMIYDTDVVVIGGGPGGYTAAIHAADLGKDVVLVEEDDKLGGVCLTRGCIPSKTLIHVVNTANSVKEAQDMGIVYKEIGFDAKKLATYIRSTVKDLSDGVARLVENRDIELVHGHARFIQPDQVYVDGANTIVRFKNAVIATGSRINELPQGLETGFDQGVWTSAQALEVPEIPESLLVIGGGYIGLEIGQAYAGLGSRVTLVEFSPQLLAAADKDLVQVVLRQCEKQFAAIYTDSRVTKITKQDQGFQVDMATKKGDVTHTFSRVLAATGRKPDTGDLGLSALGIDMDDNGRIAVDEQCRTSLPHIFAVGDVVAGPALAHKAGRQGRVAAEVIAGKKSAYDNVSVPAVLFTSPEIAWTGLTETRAKEKKLAVNVGKFPLTALGRARSVDKTRGFVKILSDPDSEQILGMAIVGEHASELIAEGNLAIEMGACLEDLIVSIHPHPTFSESIMEAAETARTGSVHLMKKRR